MSQSESQTHPFIQHLYRLGEAEDRRALAHLRRGLGKKPGTASEMFPYVVPWLPSPLYPQDEMAYYAIASLFALHPAITAYGNMGDHMAATVEKRREEAVERRFVALLSAHPDDLPDFLRQAISYLASKETPVNWDRLFRDMRYWGHPDHGDRIRKQWATAFWRYRKPEQNASAS